VPNIPVWGAKCEVLPLHHDLEFIYALVLFIALYRLCPKATNWYLTSILLGKLPWHSRQLSVFRRVQLHGITDFPHYSINIDLLSVMKLMNELNLSLTIPSRRWEVINKNMSGAASKFATQAGTSNQISGTNVVSAA